MSEWQHAAHADTDTYVSQLPPTIMQYISSVVSACRSPLTDSKENMSEVASLQCVPQLTLEEKLSALEIKFTALEKKYSETYNKGFTVTENSSGKSTEVGIAQVWHEEVASFKTGLTSSGFLPLSERLIRRV